MKRIKKILVMFTLMTFLALGSTSCGNDKKVANDANAGEKTSQVRDSEILSSQNEVVSSNKDDPSENAATVVDENKLKEMEELIEEKKNICPFQKNEGTTMIQVNYDGKVYEEVFEIPADIMELFKYTADSQKESAVNELKNSYSNGYDTLTQLLIDNGITIRTVYVNGDNKFVVEVMASEVK